MWEKHGPSMYNIRHLRQKLEDDDKNPIYIETVRGIGYRFNDLES